MFRGGKELFYDVDFDEETQMITGGRPVDISDEYDPDVIEAMNIASRFTNVDKATLLAKILDYKESGNSLRRPLGSGREAVAVLNGNFIDTFSWPRKNRKGPGEAAMHIAFKSDPSIREPDFVGADDGIRISIKYLGEKGTKTALTGDSRNSAVPTITNNLNQILGINNVKTLSSNEVYKALSAMSSEDKATAIDLAYEVMSQLKIAIATEHGADGTLLISGDNSYYVTPQSAPQMISVIYIRGSRVDFGGPECTSTSIEDALYKAQAEIDASKKK